MHMNVHFLSLTTTVWCLQELNPVVEGAIASLPVYKVLPGFQEYFYSLKPSKNRRNPWFFEFWSYVFKCSWTNSSLPKCDETKDLKKQIVGTEFGVMHFVRDAVYAYGNALVSMHTKLCNKTKGICDQLKISLQNEDAQPLLHYLKNGTFNGLTLFCFGKSHIWDVIRFHFRRGRSKSWFFRWTRWVANIYTGKLSKKKRFRIQLGRYSHILFR